MLKIDVERKFGSPATVEQGRDLFIEVYEFLIKHYDDCVDLDFGDCETKPEFFEGFVFAARDSLKLPLIGGTPSIEKSVFFSGLMYQDIKILNNAFLSAKHEKDTQAQIEELMPELRQALGKLQNMGKR